MPCGRAYGDQPSDMSPFQTWILSHCWIWPHTGLCGVHDGDILTSQDRTELQRSRYILSRRCRAAVSWINNKAMVVLSKEGWIYSNWTVAKGPFQCAVCTFDRRTASNEAAVWGGTRWGVPSVWAEVKKNRWKIKVSYKNERINIKNYTGIKPTKKIKNTIEESVHRTRGYSC